MLMKILKYQITGLVYQGLFHVSGPNTVGKSCSLSELGHSTDFNVELWTNVIKATAGHDIDAEEFSVVDVHPKAGVAPGGVEGEVNMN